MSNEVIENEIEENNEIIDTSDLDLKWIENEEKIVSIENGIFREQMENIKIKYVYINCNNSIDAVDNEVFTLDSEKEGNKIIPNDILLKMVEKRRTIGNTKYKFINMLIFNVTLDTDEIQKYNANSDAFNKLFLKEIPIVKDVIIEPSIFVFHEINTIYILFKEIDRPKTLKAAITNKIKPILKTGKENRRTKKKVKIDLDSNVIITSSGI